MADKENLCWYVGAVWSDANMTDKLISEGYWENEWDDKFINLVNQIHVGDRIAIKSSYTQKNNLPFDIKGGTASVMAIKCIGTVTKNYQNGKRVDVEWKKEYKQKTWYFFTGRTTIWKVERNSEDWMYGALLDFTLNDNEQDYKAFLAHPYWANKYNLKNNESDRKYLYLIDEYKKFFAKNKKAAFDDEVYKWNLLTQNAGKSGIDLINAVRTSKNLIYQSDAATLKTLSEHVPGNLIQIVTNLLDESKELVLRLSDFKRDMKTLVQNNLNSTNYAEDERTAANYLTYSYPEKYTFYTWEIYDSFCKYLGIKPKATGEIYSHYCELLHKLENFVSKDDELLEMIENNTCNCIQSNLLLSQNIVYVMLKEKYLIQIAGETKMINEKAQTLAKLLKNTHNLILHGAPGTGKTYIARQIAKEMGCCNDEIGFVQFHPSYDYTDFVEGIRPKSSSDGSTDGFERKDGVFKKFCERALKNLEDSKKSVAELKESLSFTDSFNLLCEKIQNGEIKTIKQRDGLDMDVVGVNDSITVIYLKTKNSDKEYTFSYNRLLKLSEVYKNQNDLSAVSNIDKEFRAVIGGCHSSGYWGVLNTIYSLQGSISSNTNVKNVEKIDEKSFIFIIDEINRGELSKIFGELFFSIDPGYRGEDGLVQTQYQNLVSEGDIFKKGFYVPENVYIIGTMNDIDRSVESMDLAMRRRFTFKEITAEDSSVAMLTSENKKLKEANITDEEISEMKKRMKNLNDKIVSADIGLSSAYQIGAAYFLKYVMYKEEQNPFECLWNYNLEGLLREYLRGQGDSTVKEKMKKLKEAYDE